ncbi:MAG: YceI family protein [Bacteroidales bacterium]|jgi:polyisoprenoid-binding protein YceI
MKMIKARLSNFLMILFVSSLMLNFNLIQAQSEKASSFTSSVIINGTSNLHDWDTKIEQLTGEFALNSSKQIQTLTVKIPVKAIKSGDKLMDKKTYETINADKNPTILFQLTEPATPVISDDGNVQVTLIGNLTVAGVTKTINLKSSGKKTGGGGYQLKGTIPLKLSDFKMKTPTAMFGLLKTGDAVTITFNVTVSAQNLASLN